MLTFTQQNKNEYESINQTFVPPNNKINAGIGGFVLLVEQFAHGGHSDLGLELLKP
jgi:hypothetical protein